MENKPIDPQTCKERHERIDARLKEHDDKIDALEKSDATNTNEIKNLCKQIKSLVTVLYWFIGLIVTGFAGFFFWYIQGGVK